MQRRFQYLAAGCGAVFALAVGYLVLGVDVPTTTAATGTDPGVQTVNRSIKGDRLQIKPATRLPTIPASKSRRNAGNEPELESPNAPFSKQEPLLDGCEPIVSPIGQSPLAQVPGRCLS
jgi:hypothetical protein